ncbi:DUF2339 domain-containing protein [Pseudocnuella soli]|uniref:DUF2339 domain-containing protein n=1 Tax=Pseudocnuella soli TaxID=2502779 RepID=UPI00105209C0|nr:DUF2339 domain-containing protein [Pseudocnuella soli]
MDEQDELAALRQEVQAIRKNMEGQYARLQQIETRIAQLQGGNAHKYVQPSSAQPKITLENFIGLRLIHIVGIVVLVIGVSIGVKYAFDRNLISETTRIALAYGAGALLLLFAYRLRKDYERFSAILFSGAMATFYFTSYAAHVYYGLLPFAAVFALMVLLTIFTAFEAVRYKRPEIALLGLIGAYGIPFLVSKNSERADLLFLYILIINCGVLFLRIKMDWRVVGQVAQALTWLLFIGWSSTRFTSAQTGSATTFLIAFFILFSIMALYAAWRQKESARPADAYQQVLNNAALYFSALFVFSPAQSDAGLAAVSICCALFAALQGGLFYKILPASPLLRQMHYMWAVALAVLAAAFYLDGLPVTLLWLLLAVGMFALGAMLREKLWRLASLALMALTLIKLLALDSQRFSAGHKVVAYVVLGLLLLIVSFFYQKFRQRWFGE